MSPNIPLLYPRKARSIYISDDAWDALAKKAIKDNLFLSVLANRFIQAYFELMEKPRLVVFAKQNKVMQRSQHSIRMEDPLWNNLRFHSIEEGRPIWMIVEQILRLNLEMEELPDGACLKNV